MSAAMGPLFLEPKLDSRLWGGAKLAGLLGLTNAPRPLAEVWQVWDGNRVARGPLQGQTLAEVAQAHGETLLGTSSVARFGRQFPLLTKLIDAADDLSIQVHPDDAQARAAGAPGGFGKTEAWYVLDCAPGASLIHGFSRPIDRASFEAMLEHGGLEQVLRRLPIRAGQALLVPARTIHAITAGVMLFEVQQRSDVTYRVYDYDRVDAGGQKRPLHVREALSVLNFEAGGPELVDGADGAEVPLVGSAYFRMDRLRLHGQQARRTTPASFEILMPVDSAVELDWAQGTEPVRRGEAVVLPAGLGGYRLRAARAELIRCTVPSEAS